MLLDRVVGPRRRLPTAALPRRHTCRHAWGSPSVVLTVQTLLTVVGHRRAGLRHPWRAGHRLRPGRRCSARSPSSVGQSIGLAGRSVAALRCIVGALVLIDARARVLARRASRAAAGSALALVPALVVLVAVALIFGPAMLDAPGRLWRRRSADLLGRPRCACSRTRRCWGRVPATGWCGASRSPSRASWTSTSRMPTTSTLQTARGARAGGPDRRSHRPGRRGSGSSYRAMRGVDPVRRRWAWAATFGLIYLALNVVVDSHTILPACSLLAGSAHRLPRRHQRPRVIGAACGPSRSGSRGRAPGRAAVALVAACVLALVPVRVRVGGPRPTSGRSPRPRKGTGRARSSRALRCRRGRPRIVPYQLTRGPGAAAATATGRPPRRLSTRQSAVDDLPKPGWAWPGAGSSWAGPPMRSLAALEEAWRLGERSPRWLLRRRRRLRPAGPGRAGRRGIRPTSLTRSPAWPPIPPGGRLGAGRFSAIVDAAMRRPRATGWEIALMAGERTVHASLAAAAASAL